MHLEVILLLEVLHFARKLTLIHSIVSHSYLIIKSYYESILILVVYIALIALISIAEKWLIY